MKTITFPIIKSKLSRKKVIIGLAVVILIVLGVVYTLNQKNNFLQGFDIGKYLKNFAANVSFIFEKRSDKQEIAQNDLEINVPPQAVKVYEEIAEKGDGITHLARRALKEYINRTRIGQDLTPEHKIYIEDYLTKKTGDRWLEVGEKISFSEDLIKEAINKANNLTSSQLNNLKQYSAMVTSF